MPPRYPGRWYYTHFGGVKALLSRCLWESLPVIAVRKPTEEVWKDRLCQDILSSAWLLPFSGLIRMGQAGRAR